MAPSLSRRLLACALAGALLLTPGLSRAQQTNGLLAGKATDEVKPPYLEYTVQIRNTATGEMVASRTLDFEGKFSFPNLPLNQRYVVELVHVKQNRIVCTEGPYGLMAQAPSKADVNIDCGKPPALLWLLAAGAGTAALLGATQASGSR
jgi:hypothetical protein